MNFIPFEQRARHSMVDATIAHAVEGVVNDAAVSNALGRALVGGFQSFADGYYVPDIKDGVVCLSPGQRASTGQAVQVFHPKEDVLLSPDFAEMSVPQMDSLTQELRQIGSTSEDARSYGGTLNSQFKALAPAVLNDGPLDYHRSYAATVSYGQSGLTPEGLTLHVRGRSLLCLKLPQSGVICCPPDLMVHEYVHTVDRVAQPIIDIPDMPYGVQHSVLAAELDGYGAQAIMLQAQQSSGKQLSIADTVYIHAPGMILDASEEAIRLRANPIPLFDRKRDDFLSRLKSGRH